QRYIDSDLFRPPYGRIKRFQLRLVSGKRLHLKTVMWSVLSGDFEKGISPKRCLNNVLRNVQDGNIVVFHDSEKSFDKLKYALPEVLRVLSGEDYRFERILL